MTRTVENLAPGKLTTDPLVAGDWFRETWRDAQGNVISIVEHEYHGP